MNPTIQLELWQLIIICAVCLGAGFCAGVVTVSLATMAGLCSRAEDRTDD